MLEKKKSFFKKQKKKMGNTRSAQIRSMDRPIDNQIIETIPRANSNTAIIFVLTCRRIIGHTQDIRRYMYTGSIGDFNSKGDPRDKYELDRVYATAYERAFVSPVFSLDDFVEDVSHDHIRKITEFRMWVGDACHLEYINYRFIPEDLVLYDMSILMVVSGLNSLSKRKEAYRPLDDDTPLTFTPALLGNDVTVNVYGVAEDDSGKKVDARVKNIMTLHPTIQRLHMSKKQMEQTDPFDKYSEVERMTVEKVKINMMLDNQGGRYK